MIDQKMNKRTFRWRPMMSIRMGIEMSPTKGQPSSTEMAVKKIASLYFWCHQAASADMLKYIEKELGRSAADEMNIPALKSWNTSQERPMWTPNSRQTPLQEKETEISTSGM